MREMLKISTEGFIWRHNLWNEEQVNAIQRILKTIEEKNLRLIRVAWADQHGISRAKTLTIPAFMSALKDGIDFNTGPLFFDTANAIVFNPFIKGGGFDLEELTGCPNYTLVPDPLTFKILPWAPNTGWILSDAYLKTGEILPFDSRQICRKALKELNEKGYDLVSGLEVEFSLTKIVSDEINPELLGAPGSPGQPPKVRPVARGYQYQLEAHNDEIDEVIQLIVENIEALGLPLRTIEDEWGPSQIEVTFAPMRGIEAADAMLLFRTAVKQICKRHGYLATFMCRPSIPGFFSSGWHLHQSLVDVNTGENLFMPEVETESLSVLGKHYTAGILKNARAATVFTTPTINGYKRFKPNSLAPDRAGWGVDNRGTMIRVLGGYGDKATHFENRAGEPAANPYLYFASQIFAGLDGIENRLDPGPASSEAYMDQRELIPKSLQEAVDSLRENGTYQNKMGKMFVDYIIRMKESEISRYMAYVENEKVEDYQNIVTEWEHKEYFENF
ncbi:glutamine synthetase family protein [Schinkia azotoformans]|uniref:glutamine synthetase n=1 Tax=Schinkia azotoformans LMG 9581 TaxID=1131731 RepID=K6BZH3_SCHAZ|nr:glutamine synthetase family protein [Schinkia azotoformans]EKN64315.1 L-glutamine synthetase [Schinkia azotoformans LMG 9581]MEC1637976.1 glutamine synthetase family protein [Schinkia azotoformans]MEC1944873.1 glutamine synthetase family protein [Schinkia azotoformans]